MAMSDPKPTRFDEEELRTIKQIQRSAKRLSGRKLSISDIVRRCVRFSAPLFITGEQPFSDVVLIAPPKRPVKPGPFFSPKQ